MKVVIMKDNIMNTNSKQDTSNLNINYNHHGGGLGASSADDGSIDRPAVAQLMSESNTISNMSNLDYLKNLADVMAGQDVNKKSLSAAASSFSQQGNSGGFIMPSTGGGINFHGASSNNNMTNSGPSNFAHVQNNNAGSDTDTCASNVERRVSRDSLVSHDSLSDMLSADQVASNNLAMMNMIATQHQQMGNQNMNFNFSTNNNAIQQQQQQHQALNQSMSQLMNHHQMSQQLKGSMMNNAMGGWNAAANNAGNNSNPININDVTLRNAYAVADNGNANGNPKAPLLIPPKKTKNKHKQTFAQKLMNILAVKDCQNAIRWMPNGCAFCIVDSKALVDKVLPKFFKEAKYTSFTRKLNRWGFKHFTLPTSEASHDKEMCIYTHEKFLRDNPDLCQQMDGGHRRRNSSTSTREASIQDSAHHLGMGQASGGGGMIQQDAQQLQQQQNMMMQQMQQLQQQNMMMQQMQQQAQQQQLPMSHTANQAGQNPMFDMSGGGATNFNSMMFNNNSNNPSSMMGSNMNLMDANGSAALGMRRTSLGFMPYLPASNRRDSGFSIGGMSAVSNDMGSSFTNSRAGNAGAGDAVTCLGGGAPQQLGAVGTSNESLEKFRKMSPHPTSGGGADAARTNANFDDYKVSAQGSQLSNALGGIDRGNNNDSNDVVNQEDFHHSQAKLAVLEDMIAKERRKQSLLSSLDPDPVKMV